MDLREEVLKQVVSEIPYLSFTDAVGANLFVVLTYYL